MVAIPTTWRLHLAGLVALAGYGLLAWQAGSAEARPALAVALGCGWVGLGLGAWRVAESLQARWIVVGWAVLFRLVGVGTEPSWEDDYHRYLWDGYQMLETGNPYARAPLEFFGADAPIPPPVAAALDGINHPNLKTIYGPLAQVVFGVAAWLGLGSLWVLKLGLVVIEGLGWWVARGVLRWRGWVLVWWCPLAVTETAFAGHPDAIGVAGLAVVLATWKNGQVVGSAVSGVVSAAVKPWGWVVAPFLVDRFGWRSAGTMLASVLAIYGWFLMQGSGAEWPALVAMSQRFEYNSTGFALLSFFLPDGWARRVSFGLTVGFAGWMWVRWRQGDRTLWPPIAAILGVAFWWAPVVNPWYALWLLPSLAVRPNGWGLGVLVAIPLAYTHGWGQDAGGAVVSYVHPWWTRPAEVGLVIAIAIGAAWWRRRGAARQLCQRLE